MILLISSILSLKESAILDAPLWPSQLINDNSSLPELEQENFSSPGPSAPEIFQQQQASAACSLYSPTDRLIRLSAYNDPNKPRFTLLEPATLRLSLRAWDAYSQYGPLTIFECLPPNMLAALRREFNITAVPSDNITLRPLLESLLTGATLDSMVDLFKPCKMANSKKNSWDSTDPIAMYNYLQRFYVFLDNHSLFYEKFYPDPATRFSVIYKLFCSGIQPECIRSIMVLAYQTIRDLPSMKARWVEQIEKVRFTLSIASLNSKSNKSYKENRQLSGGQNSNVTAAQLSYNTAHNSGYHKSATTQSNQKTSDTA